MKVVQLGPYPPPHGGVQSNLVAIREYLERHGVASHVVNLTRHRSLARDGIFYPRTGLQVLRLLFAGHYDIIHLHLGGNLTSRVLLLGLACTLVPRARTVITLHSGGWPGSRDGMRTRPASLTGLVFRRADGLIAVNNAIVDFLRRLGVPAERLHLIPPHSLPSLDTPDSGLPSALEEFYHSHTPVLATVGLLEPEYDLALQLNLVRLLIQDFPEAGLVIVGSGSLERDLRQMILANGLADRVALCGDLAHATTLTVIARARLFLRTTHYDGDSVAVREALHLGTPVIASDNGMRPAGVTLVPARNLTALHHVVAEALSGPASVRELDRRGDDRNIAAVFDLYRQLLDQRLDHRRARSRTVV